VLVVDDTPENLALLADLLQPEYRVRAATCGARALEIVRERPRPDLVLLDVAMRELDGYAVLQAIVEDPATRDVPVIFVTAMDGADHEERGLRMGAVDFITKPFRPSVVLARVRTQIALKAATDRLRAQNAGLEAEVTRRVAENAATQDVTIFALARLAEKRDWETGGHIARTSAYVRILAEELARRPAYRAGLDATTIELIARSAPLHDIGKVGIPDRILRKPGRLTESEWQVMRTHTLIGADALAEAERDAQRPAPFLRYAKEIARHHHERWDGTGYPDRLAGSDIPLSARLMALADNFDALISTRVYKPALPWTEARDVIVAGAGTHFDPAVVEAFLATFDRFVAVAEAHLEIHAEAANEARPAFATEDSAA
jgi:putative two-component system response regulator